MTRNCRGRYCEPGDAQTGEAQAHEKREAVRRRRREASAESDAGEANDAEGLFGGLVVRILGDRETEDG